MYPNYLKNKIINRKNKLKNFDLIILMNNHKKTEEILIKNLNKTLSPKFIYDCWNIVQKETVVFFIYKYMSLSNYYF